MNDLISCVEQWAIINSFSHNLKGIDNLCKCVAQVFETLSPDETSFPSFQEGHGLLMKKRAAAPLQVYLGGHLDTVFPADHPFQSVTYLDANRLRGPGVLDMKGGLAILFRTLQRFEASPVAQQLGWTIFLNPDEEIGSPHSTPFIRECAKSCAFGLIFEPPLENQALVCARKGSRNYRITVSGKAAHAGREPEKGKNAIVPLAHFLSAIAPLHAPEKDCVLNVGTFTGGTSSNTVPENAEATINVRSFDINMLESIENTLFTEAARQNVTLTALSARPPKLFDPKTETLFDTLKACGAQLGLSLTWESTGGVCDGNTLADMGIPTIDTLGAQGGKAHTDQEFIYCDSLEKQAQLVAALLVQLVEEHVHTRR